MFTYGKISFINKRTNSFLKYPRFTQRGVLLGQIIRGSTCSLSYLSSFWSTSIGFAENRVKFHGESSDESSSARVYHGIASFGHTRSHRSRSTPPWNIIPPIPVTRRHPRSKVLIKPRSRVPGRTCAETLHNDLGFKTGGKTGEIYGNIKEHAFYLHFTWFQWGLNMFQLLQTSKINHYTRLH